MLLLKFFKNFIVFFSVFFSGTLFKGFFLLGILQDFLLIIFQTFCLNKIHTLLLGVILEFLLENF